MDDTRVTQIAADTQRIEELKREILQLRARRAAATWQLVGERKETIASIARKIGEPEIRFRKSVETYRDGIPTFKRAPSD